METTSSVFRPSTGIEEGGFRTGVVLRTPSERYRRRETPGSDPNQSGVVVRVGGNPPVNGSNGPRPPDDQPPSSPSNPYRYPDRGMVLRESN